MIRKILNGKEEQLPFLIFIGLILLVNIVIVTAENLTEDNQEIEEIIDLCKNIICEESTLECPDGFIVSCSNSCNLKVGECSSCILDCEGHEIQPSEPVVNETVEALANETVSEAIDENATILNIVNETPIPKKNATNSETDINQSPEVSNESNEEIVSDSNETLGISPQIPNLDIQIIHETKATRKKIIELKVNIANSGKVAKDVTANWILPKEFEIIFGNVVENCGDIGKNEFCISIISVQPSLITSLGNNEIKVEVSYNE